MGTFSVIPSVKVSSSTVESYNAVFTLEKLMNNTDHTHCIDNEVLFNICSNTLRVKKPNYSDFNHLIKLVMSGITTSLRFPSKLSICSSRSYI